MTTAYGFGDIDPRELPLYSVHESARFIQVPANTLRSWVTGRPGSDSEGRAPQKPLIKLLDQNDGRMSFNNLVEAYVLVALRKKHGASMSAIRKAIAYAEEELGVSRLLLSKELRTSGGMLFWDQLTKLINLSRSGQLAMRQILEQHLKRVEWDTEHLPIRLYPFVAPSQESKTIVIDPRISFGKPTIAGSGIATAVIAKRIDAGEDVDALACDYGLDPEDVKDAVTYEAVG